MSKTKTVLNTLSHRVYRDVDGRNVPIRPGGTYEGTVDDENGQLDAESKEAQAWAGAHAAESGEALDPTLEAIVAATAAGGSMATARLRDPHATAEQILDDASEAAEEAVENIGKPIGVVETDPETGAVLDPEFPSDAPDPGHPEPEPAPDSAGTVTTNAPDGSGGVVDPATPQPTPQSAGEYAEGVEFTSAAAENKADELVAAGKLDTAALKPGEGTGKGDAYTVKDVEAAASSE